MSSLSKGNLIWNCTVERFDLLQNRRVIVSAYFVPPRLHEIPLRAACGAEHQKTRAPLWYKRLTLWKPEM
jgi:hypothetical protein